MTRAYEPLHGAYKLLEGEQEGERRRTKYHTRNYEADKSGVSPFGLSNLINTLFISISFSSTYMHVQPCSCGWKVSCKIHRWIVASCPYKVGCMQPTYMRLVPLTGGQRITMYCDFFSAVPLEKRSLSTFLLSMRQLNQNLSVFYHWVSHVV